MGSSGDKKRLSSTWDSRVNIHACDEVRYLIFRA